MSSPIVEDAQAYNSMPTEAGVAGGAAAGLDPEAFMKHTISSMVTEAAISMAVLYFIFTNLVWILTRRDVLQKLDINEAIGYDIACKTVSGLFASAASIAGIRILSTYDGSGYNPLIITHIMPIAMGYFLYDVRAMYEVYLQNKSTEEDKTFKKFVKSQPLMAVHHLSLSLFFIPLMVNRRDHGPGDPMYACALIMESSTPFVSIRAILQHVHLRKNVIYVVNGVVMMLVFFCCRILIYPIFYSVHGASIGLSMLEAVMATPPRCAFWMILVLLPQLYWFRIMFIGAVKVVKEKVNEENQIPDANLNGKIQNGHAKCD